MIDPVPKKVVENLLAGPVAYRALEAAIAEYPGRMARHLDTPECSR
jgi:hypothetical protein